MRLATLASIGLIAASSAALAQVASTPDEQKVPAAGANTPGGNDMAPMGRINGMEMSGNDTAANTTSPVANDMAPATAPTEKKNGRRR